MAPTETGVHVYTAPYTVYSPKPDGASILYCKAVNKTTTTILK